MFATPRRQPKVPLHVNDEREWVRQLVLADDPQPGNEVFRRPDHLASRGVPHRRQYLGWTDIAISPRLVCHHAKVTHPTAAPHQD
jgi:hypothetical protein